MFWFTWNKCFPIQQWFIGSFQNSQNKYFENLATTPRLITLPRSTKLSISASVILSVNLSITVTMELQCSSSSNPSGNFAGFARSNARVRKYPKKTRPRTKDLEKAVHYPYLFSSVMSVCYNGTLVVFQSHNFPQTFSFSWAWKCVKNSI